MSIDRRQFILGSAGIGVLATLAACGSSAGNSAGGSSGGSAASSSGVASGTSSGASAASSSGASAVSSSGASSAAVSSGAPGGASTTVTVGIATLGQQYIDPELANAGGSTYPIKWAAGEGLVRQDLSSQYVPALATGWTVSSDKLTWTFHLRPGVKMQDGSAFTATDVKTAIDRIDPTASEWSSYAAYKSKLASVTVVDDATVTITSKAPYATLAEDSPCPIATAYYKRVGEQAFRKAPIAAGPFKVVGQQLNESVSFERFDDFWDTSRVPNFGKLVFQVIPDESTRLAALQSGQIDINSNVSSASEAALKGAAGIKLYRIPNAGQAIVKFPELYSGTKTPLSDVRVRKALLLALDRASIASSLYRGDATVPNNLTMPQTFGADQSLQPLPYDPTQAKQLLAEAGASSFSFTLHLYSTTSTVPNVQQLAQAMVGYWQQVGVNVTLDVVDPTAYLAKVIAHEYSGGIVLANPGQSITDPNYFSTAFDSTGSFSSLKNAEVDHIFDELNSAVNDPTAEAALSKQLSENFYQNIWALPVVNVTVVVAAGPKIANYQVQAGNPYPGPFTSVSVK